MPRIVAVVRPRLDVDAVVQVGSRLALHPRIREVDEPRNTGTCLGNVVTVSPRFFPVTIDDSSDPRYQEEIR